MFPSKGGEVLGLRVVAGELTFNKIRYRIRGVESGGKKRLTGGTIDARPEVLAAIQSNRAGQHALLVLVRVTRSGLWKNRTHRLDQ
jgi:hypothetical protein